MREWMPACSGRNKSLIPGGEGLMGVQAFKQRQHDGSTRLN